MGLAVGLAANAGAAPRFVGVDGCKCHKMEISDWENSKHGQAFQLLESGKRRAKKKKAGLDPEKDYRSTEKCLKCHTTGYKQEGGFVDDATTPGLAGIGCEMCHGPGSEYREIHKKKTTTFTVEEAKAAGQLFGSINEAVCRRCHEHKDTPFQPNIDAKYRFNLKEALKDSDAFHKLYPLEGKHE